MKKSTFARHINLLSSTLATLFLLTPYAPTLALDKDALPAGETVIGGTASFDRSTPNTLTITQNTDRLLIEWNKGFDIGKNATANFIQPSSDSVVVNRITDKGSSATQIFGSLNANGKVIILDPNGVVFDKTARIDVGGLIASTGTINDKAFLAGDTLLKLENFTQKSIKNLGTITVADTGLAALVAPTARNDGVITAKLGTVVMGNAETVTLDLYGDSLFEVTTGKDLNKTSIINAGKIDVSGGKILLPAALIGKVITNIVNMDGIDQSDTFKVTNGKIILGTATKYVPVPAASPVISIPAPVAEISPEPAPITVASNPVVEIISTPATPDIIVATAASVVEAPAAPQSSIVSEEMTARIEQPKNTTNVTSWLHYLFYRQLPNNIVLDDTKRLRTVNHPNLSSVKGED